MCSQPSPHFFKHKISCGPQYLYYSYVLHVDTGTKLMYMCVYVDGYTYCVYVVKVNVFNLVL